MCSVHGIIPIYDNYLFTINFMHFFIVILVPPCELVMTDYSKHKKKKKSWRSPPFYTKPGGYKLYLRVYANGTGDGAGTHVSVFVYILKGEHDDILQWPFKGTIVVQLLNQKNNKCHLARKLLYDSSTAEVGQRVTSKEQSFNKGWGYNKFLSHIELETVIPTRQYVKNDSIIYRVAEISLQTDSV